MTALIGLSRAIDSLGRRIGRAVSWLVLAMVLISAANAVSRYALNLGSNAWLEAQWYLFSAVFLLAAAHTLERNEHIRIDILSNRFPRRVQLGIEIAGTLLFLLPMAALIAWLAWPVFLDSWTIGERSSDAGGLIRWPVKLLIPVAFSLLVLQGVSELIKKVAILAGRLPDGGERPHSAPGDEAR